MSVAAQSSIEFMLTLTKTKYNMTITLLLLLLLLRNSLTTMERCHYNVIVLLPRNNFTTLLFYSLYKVVWPNC